MTNNAFCEENYHKKFDLGLWHKILKYLRPYRLYLGILGVVMILVGGIDAILPMFTLYAIDNYVTPGNIDALPWFALFYFGVICLQAVNVWFLIVFAGKIEISLCHDIRRTGFARLQELSFSYFDRTPVGWLMARMTSDCERLGKIISWGFVDLIWGFFMMFSISAIMLYLNWQLALIVLSVVPALALVSAKFKALILHSYREARKTNSRITGAFNEGIMGVETTKTLVREQANLGEFQELTLSMRSSSLQAAIHSALYLPIVLLIGTIGCGLSLWYGGSGVIAGSITYGTLVAFIAYSMQFFEPIQQIARIFAELQNAQASAERIFTMIETTPEIRDAPEIITQEQQATPPQIQGQVTFVNVDFAYKNGERVLSNFNLDVRHGETIALVGESGGGKSTIVNLLCRFYQPTAGRIEIDGVDYRQRSIHWLQSNLGVVLQTPHLFNGTIAENIRYGNLDATDDEIEAAAHLVNAHDFVIKFKDGYNTEVGEGGNLLSTGQKQLISFSRAILANPPLFVMDEATSSVDTETEQLIQQAVEKVLRGRTSFIIAHRLSTIRSADRIMVIEKGKITEQGKHRELLQRKGYYHRLYTSQFAHVN